MTMKTVICESARRSLTVIHVHYNVRRENGADVRAVVEV